MDRLTILRFEDFETDNGPDLFAYLKPADAAVFGFDGEFVDLGCLKGNVGEQNYEIPVDVNLSDFATVVAWCKRFSVAFTAADLA
ncbi:MAG: DM13 domain-containing protein [Ilumatobacter sp.]|nr:DM13 domain-containing protein [Ilumatobacter sp.]